MKTKNKIQAVCHDQVCMASGTIGEISEFGCEFRTTQSSHAAPVFPRRSNVQLHLLDETSGHSMAVTGRLSGVSRGTSKEWVYKVRWNGLPKILAG